MLGCRHTSLRYVAASRSHATDRCQEVWTSHVRMWTQVDSDRTPGLACRKSAGRHMRHNAVHDLIKRALLSVMCLHCWSRLRCAETMGNIQIVYRGPAVVFTSLVPSLAASHLNRAVGLLLPTMQKVEKRRSICPCLPNTVSGQLPMKLSVHQATKHLPLFGIWNSFSRLQQLSRVRTNVLCSVSV